MKYVEIAEAFNIVYPRVLRTYTEVRTVLKNMRDEVRKLPHAKKPPTGGGPALPPLPEGWQSTLLPIVKEHPATNGLDAALESGVNELDFAQTEHAERRIHSDAVDVDTTEVEINNSNSENASLPPTVSTASTLWRPRSNSNPERKLVMPPWNVIGAASNRTLKLTATEYGDSDEDHEDEDGQSPNADKKQGKANIGKARIQQKESELLELESSRIRLDLQKLNLECEKLRSEKEMLDSKNAVYLLKYELLKHKYSELGYSS